MSEMIVNKVAESGLITLDLQDLLPKEEIHAFDIAPFLFMGQVLKEKDFRKDMQQIDWSEYTGKIVAVFCSADAIIPAWAFMLVASYLQPYVTDVRMGRPADVEQLMLIQSIRELNTSSFHGQRIVVKGCGDKSISANAYLEISSKLRPVVKSLMYGEPCSTVPIYKQKPSA
jgi:hypothetical protein